MNMAIPIVSEVVIVAMLLTDIGLTYGLDDDPPNWVYTQVLSFLLSFSAIAIAFGAIGKPLGSITMAIAAAIAVLLTLAHVREQRKNSVKKAAEHASAVQCEGEAKGLRR
jgi:uncharacterized membrane protein YoaK (UPF0700 family)